MSGFQIKCYVVQDQDGQVLDVKLTHSAAHQVAKANAPASIKIFIADKNGKTALPGHRLSRPKKNS